MNLDNMNYEFRMLDIKSINLWKDNPIKRSTLDDSELEANIRVKGLENPLHVVPEKNQTFTAIDGNRRLQILIRLGATKAPALIHAANVNRTQLAVSLNTLGRIWDGQTKAQYAARHPEALATMPAAWRLPITRAMSILGDDFEAFVKDNSLSVLVEAQRIATYCDKRNNKAFVRKSALWLANHRCTHHTRWVMKERLITPDALKSAIERDKGLKIAVGLGDE